MEMGDCDSVLNRLLDNCERDRIQFGPALAFLDQFGYGDVSMNLIRRIMACPQCEIFSYLDYKDMNRWITDQDKAPAYTRAFRRRLNGWSASNFLSDSVSQGLLDRYRAAHDKDKGNSKFVVSFSMFDKNDDPLYWLFFFAPTIFAVWRK